MAKLISILMSLIMFLFPWLNIPEANIDKDAFETNYTNVFVHGFAGWGEYDTLAYTAMPYWGINSGDLMKYLNARGFDCHAASVSPTASAWDRACELYAQLTGTVTDYGEAHSKKCNHDRYGTDYSKNRLIDDWSGEDKINLFGHSFGGATVRMLASLMAYGDETECKTSDDVSPLFEGGKGDWVYSVTTLSAPHNGTSSIAAAEVIQNDPDATTEERLIVKVLLGISEYDVNDKIKEDTAYYEMDIDNALALNEKIKTVPGVYYFSYATDGTKTDENGNRVTDETVLKSMYKTCADRICAYTGTTANGYEVDEKWRANDGLVNTYSALAPLGAPSTEFDEDNINSGIWNVMEVVTGSHTTLQGGVSDSFDGRTFFVSHITMINTIDG